MSDGDEPRNATSASEDSGTTVAGWVARAKAHPVVVVLVTVVGIGSFLIATENVVDWSRDKFGAVTNPHAADYEALGSLDLDTRLEFFEESFGVAKNVYPLCKGLAPCERGEDSRVRMYLHETEDVAVRAVFDGDQLKAYTVTLRSAELTPEMTWLDWSLGRLGEETYAGALDTVDTVDQPTDQEMFLGPQATAYVEVVSAGAPAKYRGLLLGWAPDGWAGQRMAFDLNAARKVVDSQVEDRESDPAVLRHFRTVSTPNTFGEFRDDSGVGEQLRDAAVALRLLFVGTEL